MDGFGVGFEDVEEEGAQAEPIELMQCDGVSCRAIAKDECVENY